MLMDTKDLKRLIEKYWEGQTSLSEESSLRKWFSENKAPVELEAEARLFGYFNHQNEESLSSDFEDKIISQIEKTPTKTVFWNSAFLNWKVAAVVSGIIVATVVLKNPFGSSTTMNDTYENPQDAYEATKAILMTISANMNKGKKYTQQLSKFSEAQERVSEAGSSDSGDGSD